MENEQILEIRVDDALALCYIYYLFETFNNNLIKFLSKQKNKAELVNELSKYSKDKSYDCERKIKRFYNKNKDTIDIINKYSEISKFIYSNYRFSEIVTYEHSILNEYMKKNEDILFKIIRVLDRIKELGFCNIEFNENLDFTEEIYITSIYDYRNHRLNYLENLELIPSRHKDEVKYRTKKSNYKIISTKCSNDNRIILNNLTFDESHLPESISPEYIQEQILKLEKDKIPENPKLSNLSIEELHLLLYKLNKLYYGSSINIETRKQILNKIKQVKQKIEELSKQNKPIINHKIETILDEKKIEPKKLKRIKQ